VLPESPASWSWWEATTAAPCCARTARGQIPGLTTGIGSQKRPDLICYQYRFRSFSAASVSSGARLSVRHTL